jgi:hypothetical protein
MQRHLRVSCKKCQYSEFLFDSIIGLSGPSASSTQLGICRRARNGKKVIRSSGRSDAGKRMSQGSDAASSSVPSLIDLALLIFAVSVASVVSSRSR